MAQPDLNKVPTPEEARALLGTVGKRGKELAENAAIAEEAKEMSKNYVPRAAALRPTPAGAIGSGDITLPDELRRFNPGPGIHPMSEADYAEKYDSGNVRKSWEEREKERQQAILDAEQNDYQWYIRCKECLDHGVYLTRPINRGEVLGMGDWYARYKPKPEAFWDREPLCQVCLSRGLEVGLQVGIVDRWKRTWKPNPRWVWKLAKDPERFEYEGNFRAMLLEWGASNSHIDDIERRRQLYKTWKADREAKAEKAKLEVARG